MTSCAACGLASEGSLCAHHVHTKGEDWAKSNAAFCNWLHRGQSLQQLSSDQRVESFWETTEPQTTEEAQAWR